MKQKIIVLPSARYNGLVVQEHGEELLIYDLTTDKVFHLNYTARLVLDQCDGQTTNEEASHNISTTLGEDFHPDLIWFTVKSLHKSNLLISEKLNQIPQVSRRSVMKIAVSTTVTLPIVSSLIAPYSVAAQSGGCQPIGGSCATTNCCAGQCNELGVCCIISGITCFFNADCCSNICNSGVCGCLPLDDPCTSSYECCTLACSGAPGSPMVCA